MPKYSITDPLTNKTVTVEGSAPPTQAEALAIFQKAGLRQPTQTADPRAISKLPSTSQKIADFLGLGTTKNNLDTVVNFTGINTTTLPDGQKILHIGRGQDQRTDAVGAQSSRAFAQSQALIAEAKKTKDPKKKKELLDQSRAIMEASGQQMDSFMRDLNQRQQDSGITEKDLTRGNLDFAFRRGAGQSGELASWLLPAKILGAAAPAQTALGRIGQKATTGAVRGVVAGAGQGVAGAANEDTIGAALTDIGVGAAAGGVAGGAMAGLGALGSELIGKIGSKRNFVVNQRNAETFKRYGVDNVSELNTLENPTQSAEMAVEKLRKLEPGNPKNIDTIQKETSSLIDKAKEIFKGNKKTVSNYDLRKAAADRVKKRLPDEFGQQIDAWLSDASDKKFTMQGLIDEKGRISSARLGYSASGNAKEGLYAKLYQELDREIKKTLTEAAGKSGTKFSNIYNEMSVNYFLEPWVSKRSGLIQLPLEAKVRGLGHIFTAGAAKVGSLAGRAVESGVPQKVGGVVGGVSGVMPASSADIVIPPSVAALQRKLDEDRAYRQKMNARINTPR